MSSDSPTKQISIQSALAARCLLECGQMYKFYWKPREFDKHLKQVKTILGFITEFSGIKGKRTRYQQVQNNYISPNTTYLKKNIYV